DRQHLLRRGGHPDLVRGAYLRLGELAQLERQAGAARELQHDVVGDAWKDEARLWRREDYAALHHEDVRRRGFGQLCVPEQNRLGCVRLRGELAQQTIGDEWDRLDGPAEPRGG